MQRAEIPWKDGRTRKLIQLYKNGSQDKMLLTIPLDQNDIPLDLSDKQWSIDGVEYTARYSNGNLVFTRKGETPVVVAPPQAHNRPQTAQEPPRETSSSAPAE